MKSLSNESKLLYYLALCIPVRVLIAYAPSLYTTNIIARYIHLLTTVTISTGFIYLYITNQRLNAPEGGGKTWWAKYRFVHGILWGLAAFYLWKKQKQTYSILIITDILFSIATKVNEQNTIWQ